MGFSAHPRVTAIATNSSTLLSGSATYAHRTLPGISSGPPAAAPPPRTKSRPFRPDRPRRGRHGGSRGHRRGALKGTGRFSRVQNWSSSRFPPAASRKAKARGAPCPISRKHEREADRLGVKGDGRVQDGDAQRHWSNRGKVHLPRNALRAASLSHRPRVAKTRMPSPPPAVVPAGSIGWLVRSWNPRVRHEPNTAPEGSQMPLDASTAPLG
jgi:hypothetical protein